MSVGKSVSIQYGDGEVKEIIYFEKCITCNSRNPNQIMYFRAPEGVLICNKCHLKHPERTDVQPTKGRRYAYIVGHGIVTQDELERLIKTGDLEGE